MPLQNRVDPFSCIHVTKERGLFTGNRGVLHDPNTKTLLHQRWASESWVICALPDPSRIGAHDGVMLPGRWTELFFLDEAVGLAAGHRPCHSCRKHAALTYREAVGIDRVSDINKHVNEEMRGYLRRRAPKQREACRPYTLPDGAFFSVAGVAYLKWQDSAFAFSFGGYNRPEPLPAAGLRLTPNLSCEALEAGYKPVLHSSLLRQIGKLLH